MVKVSICMATHNGARYLREQIDSILPQLSSEDEFIIADDGSTDGTLDIIHSYADPRIRLVAQDAEGSPVRNFERALGHCRAPLIFLADQDDVWAGNKVTRMKAVLETCDLVVSDCSITDDALNVVHPSFYKVNRSGPGLIRNLWKNSYIGCCMAFRREILEVALPFPDHVPTHDAWLGLVAEKDFEVRFIDDALVLFRRHVDNYSTTGGRSMNTLLKKIAQRWSLVSALVNR